MYSGVDGRELEANIFFGVVYYQRLRHMVADKYQVGNFISWFLFYEYLNAVLNSLIVSENLIKK